jgi:16S rRNA G966 N2-methylase RsmD
VMATTGFRPACACPPAEPVPGVVLDPFGGSGTVGQVAIANGRRAVLIDLNAAYLPLQDKRTDGVQVTLPLEAA